MADRYPVSDYAEVELALRAAQQAVVELRSIRAEAIGHFLERFADNIEARREELVELCYQETALAKEPRLNSVELPRTTNQLRQAAAAARDRSWRHATIDTQANIRSIYSPLEWRSGGFWPQQLSLCLQLDGGRRFCRRYRRWQSCHC